MKKWKRILVTICIVLLFTTTFKTSQIGDLGKGKIVRAASDIYHNIEIDGVVWRYATFKVNINQNPKYHNLNSENIVTCVKVRLQSTNGHTDITIPDTIEGYPVYRIEQGDGIGCNKVTSLRIPNTVEWIESKAFWNWSSLKEVKFLDKENINSIEKEIPEAKMLFYHIGDEAFACCESLIDIPIKEIIFSEEENVYIGEGIYKNCSGLKKVNITSVGKRAYIPKHTFENCNLEEGIQISDNIEALSIGDFGFQGCEIQNLEISCDCSLGESVFAENKNLHYAKFSGNVQSKGEQIFKGAFCSNENTKIIFEGGNIELGRYFFSYSNVKTLIFSNLNGNVDLGYRCIWESATEDIEFKNKNVIVNEGGLESTNEKLTKITFENSDTTYLNDGAFYAFLSCLENKPYPSVKDIEFQCKKVIHKYVSVKLTQELEKVAVFEDRKIVYGRQVEQVSGTLGCFLSKFGAVYIENPMTVHEVTFTCSNPKIYGYSRHKEISPDFTMIQKKGLILRYEDSEIINTKGIELDKLHVYTELKTGNQVEIPTGKIIGEDEIPDTQKEEGFLLQYGEKIQNYEGTMPIKVYYQDTSDIIEVSVVSKKESRIQIEWSNAYGNSLIEGQTIDLNQLVKKVIVYYNDGSWVEEDSQVLELVNETVAKGENTIVVCFKGNKEIRDSFQCEGKENQIERVIASYNEKEVYLGDEVDLDKINLKAIYTIEDTSKDTNLPCKKISKNIFDLEGKNIIRVYYTDEMYSDMEVQVKVAKSIKVEAVYNENYPCYGINEEIKKEAIEVSVTLENHRILTNSELKQAYIINVVSYSENSIIATITYDGIISNQFRIPVIENKIESISPVLRKDVVLEGSLIGKELVSYLRINYENGTSELVSMDDLEQNYLQVSEGYLAVARQWNTITISYMGVSCKADIWGEEDSVIALNIQYLGDNLVVGDSIGLEDCKVYLVKKSGQKVQVTEGVVIVNPEISKIGENLIYFCYDTFQGNVVVNGVRNGENSRDTQNLDGSGKEEIKKEEGKEIENTNSKSILSIKSNYSKIKIKKEAVYNVQINKTIKINLQTEHIRNIQYQFVVKGKNVNLKKWNNVKKNCITIKNTMKKYGILYIRYTLLDGTIKTVHTTGFCIDTIVPRTNIKKNQSYHIGKKIIFSDDCGVRWAKLDGKKIKSGTKVKKIGKHTLVVMDKAGNKISIPFLIQ